MNALVAVIGLGVFSLIPIWRGAGHCRHHGVNLWKMFHDAANLTPDSPFGHPHLPYDEAVRRARLVYQEKKDGETAV